MLKSSRTAGWYAFLSRHPSLKVKSSSKNANWKNKFFFVRLSSSALVLPRWNLNIISDKIDLWASDHGFDVLEGSGRCRKLTNKFDEQVLVHASLSRT